LVEATDGGRLGILIGGGIASDAEDAVRGIPPLTAVGLLDIAIDS
jgi:hypothetical protein